MQCPFCRKEALTTIDTRAYGNIWAIRRRRECLNCFKRVTTYEVLSADFRLIRAMRGIHEPPPEAGEDEEGGEK